MHAAEVSPYHEQKHGGLSIVRSFPGHFFFTSTASVPVAGPATYEQRLTSLLRGRADNGRWHLASSKA